MAKYLDENGLLYFWQQIKTKFAGFAFSKVRITNGSTNTDLEADTTSDMLTIVNGNDITLTPTANTDTVSISHSNSGVTAASKGDTTNQAPGFGGTFKVTSGTVNARGHLTAFADHTVTIPNAVASSSSAGLMSAADKTRLDGLDGEYIELPENPANGNYLKYNGTTWVADEIPEGAAASSTTPKMDGTAAVGTENAFARGDHVHPTDTSRQAKITASGILKGNGSGGVTAAAAGTDYQAPVSFDGTYNASTNKAATVSTVTNAIAAAENVFVAIYGTTTFAEVTAAIAADKAVLLWSEAENCVAYLAFNSTTSYGFSSINLHSVTNGIYAGHQYYLTSSGWTYESDHTVVSPYGPAFINSPSAPTPTAGSNDQHLATTAFVQTAISGKIDNPSTKTSGQFLKYNGTTWVADNAPAGTVTSVRVQATSPVSSSVSTAQTGTLDTTISLANGYGDTKNPYAAKAKNLVLAGPSTGSNAAPAFRALVAADIPTLTKSKISDFPVAGTDYVVPSTLNSYVTTTTAEATYAKKTDISGAYIYKGTVSAVADLPATGNTTGDVYNVTANDMNYAWDGSAWDPLGATFTITSITNAEIDAIVAS